MSASHTSDHGTPRRLPDVGPAHDFGSVGGDPARRRMPDFGSVPRKLPPVPRVPDFGSRRRQRMPDVGPSR